MKEMETKKYYYTIKVKVGNYYANFDVSYSKPMTPKMEQKLKQKIYGIMYQAYKLNDKEKEQMLKVEITETKGGKIA